MLTVLLTIACLGSIGFYLAGLVAARRFFARPPADRPPRLPPVSILIPLSGKDFEAYDNYVSFCRQDYPEYQLVFGVNHADDSSIPVIHRLMADFPENEITLVVDGGAIGDNPKVNNLQNMLGKARHEVLVLVDSDIRVNRDYLTAVVSELAAEGTGLVTCLYRAGKASNLAAKIEAIGITAEFAPGVLVAWLVEGISFALGATIATTKANLQAMGGFQAVADYLADDFMLGQLMHRAGFEVRLSPQVVEIILPPTTFRSMMKHQLRWARGIRACRPWGHRGAFITHGTILALLLVLASGGSAMSLALFTAVLLSRSAVAYYVAIRKLNDRLLARLFWLLPLRDLFGFIFWALGQVGRRVEWRGKSYLLLQGGKMKPA